MDTKKFRMLDDGFECQNCQKTVKPLKSSSRDHCNHCLYSIHIDNNPGDRACSCLGLLKPIGIEKAKKERYKIIYQCQKCHMIKKNLAALDDNFEEMLKIASNSANKNN